MKEIDYIVVGFGIAGISFCEQLEKHNKSFVVIDHGINASTLVSGGVFNPVVLKRFTASWNTKEHIEFAMEFYDSLSKKLKYNLVEQLPVLRVLNSIQEQNDWMVASDKRELSEFLDSEIIKNNNDAITAPFGFGKVIGSGRIIPSKTISLYREYLQKKNQFFNEQFDYTSIVEENDKINYKDFSAKKILFAEGAAVINNPYFPKEFLIGNKGEYIIIKAPELQLNTMLKASMFIIPLGNDLYKVGATYNREDETFLPTENAKREIINKLKQIITCNFEVVNQVAGIRPTTKDRKPLLGNLLPSENKVFFNGLGTRGIITAPFLSKMLYSYLEEEIDLPNEVDINRFVLL
jgi:glycine oxidase